MKIVTREFLPNEGLVDFRLKIDGADEVVVQPVITPAGSRLEHDVTDIAVGQHTIEIGAYNGWEVTWDDPFVFTRPQPIQTPFGIALEK